MDIKDIFDTDYIELDNKRFCPYCGKEIKVQDTWDRYDHIFFWKCDCDDSLTAHNIKAQIKSLEHQLPKQNYKITKTITKS